MKQTDLNIVFTNENCIGCNRCIAGCPIPGANIASYKDGKNRIIVDNNRCIHCGHCITICKHSAREYKDDTESFFESLKAKVPVSLIVSPSFYIDYPEIAPKIMGYLKSLGVKHIWNMSEGADITTWAYVQYFMQHPDKGGITQPCTAVVNYIEKQRPELIDSLIPIQSPLICLATYIKHYMKNSDSIAFISPCIAKKDEIASPATHGLVQYNVTYKHLLRHLEGADLGRFHAEPEQIFPEGLGSLYPMSGGLRENLEYFIGHDRVIMSLWDLQYIAPTDESVADIVAESKEPVILDLLQCEHGCLFGTGVDKEKCSMKRCMLEYTKIRSRYAEIRDKDALYSHYMPRKERIPKLNERYKKLNPAHFSRTYTDMAKPVPSLSEEEYDKIFNKMNKTTPSTRCIDCQTCGYGSCRQMAQAIANGYNVMENCLHYERTENFRLYTTDPVTNLHNKYMMMHVGKRLMKEGHITDFVLIQFNIKNFMLFNNRFGYDGANSILKEFGHGTKNILTPQESLFHIGSDNFVAFLLKDRLDWYLHQINNMEIPSLSENKDLQMHLTVKSGIYYPTGQEQDFEEVTKYLFSTFLLSKQEKNTDTVYFDKTTSDKIVNQLLLTQQVPQALEDEEFFVMYQPKIRLCDNTLTGGEALIRWKHKDTIIPPGMFIPGCESNGLVCDLDFFVLNQVCKSIDKWRKNGHELVKISVNFSKLHFSRHDVAQRICETVDKWNIPHELIEIEFTETLYSDEQQSLNNTMNILKEKHFSASIDDFGAGYSSLSLLQNLKFDVLKLDKSLIDTITPNSQAKTVVTNIIQMAKELNMDVVAEGVETMETVHLLQELKCDIIQGYVFDKPLTEEEFEKRLCLKKYPVQT